MEKSLLGMALASQIMQASVAGAGQDIIEYELRPDVIYNPKYYASEVVRDITSLTPFMLIDKYPVVNMKGNIVYYTQYVWQAIKKFCMDTKNKAIL